MNTQLAGIWALVLLALGLLSGALWLWRLQREHSQRAAVLDRAVQHAGVGPAVAAAIEPGALSADHRLPLHWLQGRWGQRIVADEDRRLLQQCGAASPTVQWYFLAARLLLAMLLPLGWVLVNSVLLARSTTLLSLSISLVLGFMLPKWLVRARAGQRRQLAGDELPLLVDLMRLLQGVGLSLDQSLLVMAQEFRRVLPVLGSELDLANRMYIQGRSREHSLQRMAQLYEDDHLAHWVALMVQLDKHGGAVQEPLRQFGERLREQRKAQVKERIGKTTVKMTAVMVTTLLPALMIVTAGPGLLAVIRSLGAMAK